MNLVLTVMSMYAGAYLLGSIPFGWLAGRLRGVDIRALGSGNIGATNVGRVLGLRWALVVFVLDLLKGLMPVLICGSVLSNHPVAARLTPAGSNLIWLGAGLAAILGHNFSIFLSFQGGKGVATSLGAVLGFYPYLTVSAVPAVVIWIALVRWTRTVSLASISAAIVFPVAVAVCLVIRGKASVAANWPMLLFAGVISSLLIWRHRSNLARLRAGTEHIIGHSSGSG